MDLATMLRWSAERHPHRRAIGGPRPLTYAEWGHRTDQLAAAMAALGVRPGGRVAMVLAGGEPLASAHLAAQKLGAVSVPLSTRFDAAELAHCLSDASPGVVVSDASTDAVVAAAAGDLPRAYLGEADGAGPGDAPPGVVDLAGLAARQPVVPPGVPIGEDALSVMLYTAGTTGRPKGVPRTHRAEHSAAIAHVVQARYGDGEVTLGVMPMFHTMGLRTLLATIAVGGTWVPQARFEVERALELITDEVVTALYLVPTMYWTLLQSGRMPRVPHLAYAGAAMTPTLSKRLAAACRPEVFVNHLGSTEIYTFTVCPDAKAKPGCAGRPGVFSRVRIVDPVEGASPDAVVGPGETGQLVVSLQSPEAFAGYWQRPDADARAIRDGWYFTGDLAVADEDGDLWVAGRVDDMINSGGENIYPTEVEAALARCPAVAEVVVAGTPDDRWGQAVTAFVVPSADADPDAAALEVARFARHRAGLSSLKQPKRVLVVDAIPKSAVGKVLRRALSTGDLTVRAVADVGTVPS